MQTPDRAHARLLARFGISANAEAVWRALLVRPDADSERLCDMARISPAALESAVASLRQYGLIESASTPLGVAPVDPSVAVGAHISRSERQATQSLEDLSRLRAELSTLTNEYSRRRLSWGDIPALEVVVPVDDIRQRLEAASEELESDHRSLLHSVSVEGMRLGLPIDVRTLARGIHQRSVIREADLEKPGIYPVLDTLREYGETTRVHPNIPTQLMIFDRTLAVVRIDPLDPSCGAMFIRVRNLVELLVDLFDRIWDESKPLFLTGLESTPTSRGARVLALVANGVTDDAIARTLQVSRRTVGREIADLKVGLGVASRAEIVGAAVRRGWL